MKSRFESENRIQCLEDNYQGEVKRQKVLVPCSNRQYEVKKKPLCRVNVGEHLDVVSLLSNNGCTEYLVGFEDGSQVRYDLNHLRHKYLLICCVSFPSWADLHIAIQNEIDMIAMIAAYPELFARAAGAFEMLIVPNMSVNNDHDKSAFNDVFSTFPGLTIPLTVTESNDSGQFVCDYLGLQSKGKDGSIVGVILDSSHMVLHKDYNWRYDSFFVYGAALFPFTNDRLNVLAQKQMALKMRLGVDYWKSSHDPDYFGKDDSDNYSGSEYADYEAPSLTEKDVALNRGWPRWGMDDLLDSANCDYNTVPDVSLADLLCCEPSYKLKTLRGPRNKEISVSELSKKDCVGVYLCKDQSLLPNLASVYEECKANNLEFEIVVACLPWYYHPPSRGNIEVFELHSREFESTSSWWPLPYNDERNRWLTAFSFNRLDTLIIVRPDGMPWEKYGTTIVSDYGVASYPFTTDSLVERITSLTLDSLLLRVTLDSFLLVEADELIKLLYNDNINNNNNNNNACSDSDYSNLVAHLRHKNVLIYIYDPRDSKTDFLKLLCEAYRANTVPDLEVVFAPSPLGTSSSSTTREMQGWHVLPHLLARMVALRVYSDMDVSTTIVAFGKDGQIRSRKAQDYLAQPQGIESLFAAGSSMSEQEVAYLRQKVERHLQRKSEYLDDY